MADQIAMATANYSHAPVLNEDHFNVWKNRMMTHLISIDELLYDCIQTGPFVPMKANVDPATNNDILEV
jgi:hypothetical protein